ncbi:MAG TPA: M1 family aminopeptidase [Crocinitomicaceae bacterium]|nr:M1 family aminopeptidase [Crocinitomicaceae bacterium]
MKKPIFLFSAILALALSFACSNKHISNDDYSYDYDDEYYDDSDYYHNYNQEIAYEDYKATRTVYTDLINTKLEIKPDWEKSYLYGKATITAKPHFFPSDSLILDAKGMTINSVSLNGKILNYTYKDDVLKITLDKTYTRTETYNVIIDYVAKPNERKSGGGVAVTSDKGLYFINPTNEKDGYMPQIWTQGETESNSVWFPTIDSPNFKSAQEVYITVDNKYKTLSNGKLVSSTQNADGTRTDYWKQDKVHSVYLFMIAVGEFAVVEDFYTKKDGTKIPVNYYVEPEWKDQAKAIFGKTPKMIGFFSDLLGVDYQWDKYSQIIVREYVSGAMENTGAVVFGDFCYKTDRELLDDNDESIIAHELFHHWFGDLVTAESWSNLPLNESFANYSQYLWDEYEYGKDLAQYNKEEVINAYFNGFEQHKLIRFDYDKPDDMFDAHSYNKGGSILHQLRGYLGDEAFFAGLNLYLTKHAYKSAEYNDLRMAFEEISGEDLNWYFNNWFLGEGYPTVEATYSYNYEKTKLNLNFTQTSFSYNNFVVPMEIMYVDDAGKHTEKFKITKSEQQFSFDLKGKLQTIIIDPEKILLGEYTFTSTPEFLEKQFDYATNYLTKKNAIKNYTDVQTDKGKIKAFVTKALKDPFFGTQETVLASVGMKAALLQADISELVDIQTVKDLAKNGSHHTVRSAAIELLMSSSASKVEKIKFLDELSATEQSYKVLATILEKYTDLDPENVGVKIDEFALKHSSSEINLQIAGYYLQNRVEGKLDFFKSLYEKATLRDKWTALLYYGYYSSLNSASSMKNYVSVIDAVYPNTGYYKTYLAYMMTEMTQSLIGQEKQLETQIKKEKSNDKQFFLDEIKEIRVLYENFLKKYEIEMEETIEDY